MIELTKPGTTVEPFQCVNNNCYLTGLGSIKPMDSNSSAAGCDHIQTKAQDTGSSALNYPVQFVNFENFLRLDKFPRHLDNADVLCNVDVINRDTSLIVFISHAWLKTDSKSTQPDNATLCIVHCQA